MVSVPAVSSCTRVSRSDLLALEGALRELFAPGLDPAGFVGRGFAAIARLVPGELFTYSRAQPGRSGPCEIVFSTPERPAAGPLHAFARLRSRYPLWDYRLEEQGGRPIFRRDYFTKAAFRDSAMFCEAYRPMGLDNHAAVPVASAGASALFFSIERAASSDFTERERALLALLQPHLAAARALARARAACGEPQIELFADLGLSARETEVFFWLVEGKRNREIALILGLGLQTVKDHVASVFAKLGLESRHAAMRYGLEATRRARSDELRLAPALHRFRTHRGDAPGRRRHAAIRPARAAGVARPPGPAPPAPPATLPWTARGRP